MTLLPGTRLGPYEVLSPLGAGGMGEVYGARDARLGRDVALKVLPAAFATDDDRMARFEREAKVLASLNHPNIASIYGLEESNHVRALVMELVEGPTLAERIARGAIRVDEALPIAQQICEGLEYAHERGIVHRDLKPANVKLTSRAQVKILDFGLAKALDAEQATGDVANSPTLTRGATRDGIVLGTAAYMSPEQARGGAADRRVDIWAFGSVLYEMLSGKPAFGGETVSDTLAAVIRDDPDWSALPPAVPAGIRRLLAGCLRKDPRRRLQAIGDARIAIEEARGTDDTAGVATALPTPGASWRRVVPWAIAAALAIALLATVTVLPSRMRGPKTSVMHLSLAAPVRHAEANHGSAVAISPDGTRIAYVALQGSPATGKGEDLVAPRAESFELVVRNLARLAPTPLLEAPGGTSPFFSPDGRWVGFPSGGSLEKVSADGGPPLRVCDVPNIVGAWWGDDGFIYFAPAGVAEIRRVPEEGGTSTVVVKAASGEAVSGFRWPQVLPGGKTLLYTTAGASWLSQHYRTEAYSVATGKRTVVMEEAANARYLAPGYLVFTRGDVLMGAAFDATALKATGPAVPLIDGLTRDEWFGSADYALSSTGTLVYLTGGVQKDYRLMSVSLTGKVEPMGTSVRGFEDLSVSPDGKRIAVTLVENGGADVWIYDRDRDALTRLTQTGDCGDPLWSPDGSRVIYTNPASLYVVPADGSSQPESLTTGQWAEAESFTPDGRELMYSTFAAAINDATTWLLRLAPGAQPTRVLPGIERLYDGRFSPDGRWIAYVSAQSGRPQVYVQAYPGPGERVQVSDDGGREPLWAPNGGELYFRTATRLMAAAVKTIPTLVVGKPRRLFEGEFVSSHHDYGLMPDGRHFVLIQAAGTLPPAEAHVVVNWADELRARLGAAR